MKLAIMQPYFVPYIGYWQLMNGVDQYVIYDDVNFIKGGWINRNRILMNGQPIYFNLPMTGASSNKLINEIKVNQDKRLAEKRLRTINNVYRKAPFYKEVYPLIEKILMCEEQDMVPYLIRSFQIINAYLEITTELIVSSQIKKDNHLKGQRKVIEICQLLHADEYYNAIGGRTVYSFSDFKEKNIKLKFLKTKDIIYEQFGNTFQKNLSIIDVMMFNSKSKIQEFLKEYVLIEN